jgi:hypothetical protein
MGCITDNKYLRFYIENYDNILALNEIIGHSEAKLPQVVVDEVKDIILGMKSGYFDQNNLKVDSDNDYLWWYDEELYNPDEEQGVYFLIDVGELYDIISSQGQGAFLFVAFGTYGIYKKDKTEFIKSWQKFLQINSRRFGPEDITIHKDYESSDWDYLAEYNPKGVLTMKTLADKDKFRQNIQTAVQTFTDALLPVLRDYPGESKKNK